MLQRRFDTNGTCSVTGLAFKKSWLLGMIRLVLQVSYHYFLGCLPFLLLQWAPSGNPTRDYSNQDSHTQGHSSQMYLALEPSHE